MTVRVVLADDQEVVRAGLRVLLERDGDIEVVADAEDGEAAVRAVRAHRPDVVLMDIRMPVLDGIEATRRLRAGPDGAAHVLVLTTFEIDETVVAAIRAGAAGFLSKDTSGPDLRAAVRAAAEGRSPLSVKATGALLQAVRTGRPPPAPDPDLLDGLTDREREVVTLVGLGLDNLQIGRRLNMSPATAKTHVNRAMTKLGATHRAHLVVIAYQSGLCTP